MTLLSRLAGLFSGATHAILHPIATTQNAITSISSVSSSVQKAASQALDKAQAFAQTFDLDRERRITQDNLQGCTEYLHDLQKLSVHLKNPVEHIEEIHTLSKDLGFIDEDEPLHWNSESQEKLTQECNEKITSVSHDLSVLQKRSRRLSGSPEEALKYRQSEVIAQDAESHYKTLMEMRSFTNMVQGLLEESKESPSEVFSKLNRVLDQHIGSGEVTTEFDSYLRAQQTKLQAALSVPSSARAGEEANSAALLEKITQAQEEQRAEQKRLDKAEYPIYKHTTAGQWLVEQGLWDILFDDAKQEAKNIPAEALPQLFETIDTVMKTCDALEEELAEHPEKVETLLQELHKASELIPKGSLKDRFLAALGHLNRAAGHFVQHHPKMAAEIVGLLVFSACPITIGFSITGLFGTVSTIAHAAAVKHILLKLLPKPKMEESKTSSLVTSIVSSAIGFATGGWFNALETLGFSLYQRHVPSHINSLLLGITSLLRGHPIKAVLQYLGIEYPRKAISIAKNTWDIAMSLCHPIKLLKAIPGKIKESFQKIKIAFQSRRWKEFFCRVGSFAVPAIGSVGIASLIAFSGGIGAIILATIVGVSIFGIGTAVLTRTCNTTSWFDHNAEDGIYTTVSYTHLRRRRC